MSREAKAAPLEHPLFEGVEPAILETYLVKAIIETRAAGAPCIREGDRPDYFWLVLSGSARVFYVSEHGLEVTVKLFRAPAAFAEIDVITGHKHVECVSMVDRGRTARLGRGDFLALLDASPRFQRNILVDTCARFLIAVQNERALAFLSVERRLAHLVLSYARAFGVAVEGGVGLRIELSQARLALDVGVATKSVQRTLAGWKKQGLISQRGRSVVVHDLEGLEAVLGAELLGIDWCSGTRLQSLVRSGGGAP